MNRDAILLLEDNEERLDRFHKTVLAALPDLRLLTWRSARVMVVELEQYLSAARLISLDHDLEPLDDDPIDPGDGLDVAKWLAERPPACPVIIHTSNNIRGDSMEGELDLAGWMYRRIPPIGDDWIEVDWLRAARKLLRPGR